MTTTLVIEPPAAFINANDRLHWRAKAKLTAAWRGAVESASFHGRERDDYTHAHIVIGFRFPTNHRRDVGNYYPTAKAIVDGLVDACLIPDDNDTNIVGPDLRRTHPNGTPQVTVTITPLEEQS
jgi:Holliday junction resolvase RusA-like endonuclease